MTEPCIGPSDTTMASVQIPGCDEGATYLQRIIEVANLAQVVEKLIDPGFVILDERVESGHISLLGVGGFVGQVLKHLGDLQEPFGERSMQRRTRPRDDDLLESGSDGDVWQVHRPQACTLAA